METPVSLSQLKKKVYGRFFIAFVVLAGMFFLPAGTLRYWQAWLFLASLFIPMFVVMQWLFHHDPDLLERRMRLREREAEQKTIISVAVVIYLLIFLLPGFDRRWGWSNVPAWVSILADVGMLAGYALFVATLKANRYAARTVAVEEGQQVVSSGPYAHVRHPMYLSTMIIYTLSPLVLGSYWAVLPALSIIALLVARIRNEEKVLLRDLPGYAEYMQKVRYRLIPGVW